MQPLSALSEAVRRSIRGVFSDIDDTLSTTGRITSEAYAAMARLRSAGMLMIPITGRPAGWCDHIARMWPVDAVVGENGALYMRHDDRAGKLRKRYAVSERERCADRKRLEKVAQRILREVPGCALASDQPYRECDLAIDYCEDVPPLPAAEVDRIVALMREEGLTAKISSIHVNGWFGAYDKLAMTRSLLREEFCVDLDAQRAEFAFVGDSPNDASMFEFFPCSVGVANVRRFADRIATPPAYVTAREAGAGFAELVEAILANR
ncbi:MAG TPA: HAD-IIB family hydrolase [Casimicrobiaceae bacterium]|jgi:HAD superfamily hydrolase (TIGR01484 family)|nr:HAD-IIB family hydrolase [Casimicrobiaceae bacterium]